MHTQQKTAALVASMIVAMLLVVVAGCGRKADLFLPEQNAGAGTSKQQQTQTDKETDKEDKKKTPQTEN